MANEVQPLFRPGSDVTAVVTAAVTGGTFVGPDGRDSDTGQLKAKTATAAKSVLGVAAFDADKDGAVAVLRGGILPVTAGGTIAVGAQVEVGSDGKAVALASGIAVGVALEAGASGKSVLIALDV